MTLTTETTAILMFIGLLTGAIVGTVTVISYFTKPFFKKQDALYEEVKTMKEQLVKIEAIMGTQSPFWAELQRNIANELHHPDPIWLERDKLLEDLMAVRITPAGTEKLNAMLTNQINDAEKIIGDDSAPLVEKADAQNSLQKAKLLLVAMPMVLQEAEEARLAKTKSNHT